MFSTSDTKKRSQHKFKYGLLFGILISVLIMLALYLFSDYLGVLSPVPINKEDSHSALTLEVNAINNILTWGSFLVATLTIIAAVFGITGFIEFRKGVENKINEGTEALEKMKALVDNAEMIQKYLKVQQNFIEQSNNYLFSSIYSIADQMGQKSILEKQLHVIQIINLYQPNVASENNTSIRNNKIRALYYLHDNGKEDDLQHLEFVIDNENDKDIIRMAQDLAIYIRMKNNPKIYPSKYTSSLGK